MLFFFGKSVYNEKSVIMPFYCLQKEEMTVNIPFFSKLFLKSEQSAVVDKSWNKSIFQGFRDFLYVLSVFLLVYLICFRVVIVDGPSMNDTLVDGDRLLLVSSTLYRNPECGDVVVASQDSFRNGESIIKRVIATEGQTVNIDFKTGAVYVDGVLLREDYISSPTTLQEGVSFPLTVDKGCIFVMGDNRMNSMDSRSSQIGLIDRREVLGKVVFLLLPGNDGGKLKADYGRIGVI